RLVPLQVNLREVRIYAEGGSIPARRQMQRGRHAIPRQRLTVDVGDAPLRPAGARVRSRDISLLTRQIFGDSHLLQPGLPAFPAEMSDECSRRTDDVRRAVEQIAPPVTIIIDGVPVIVRRQELRLPQLPCPRSDHLARAKIATID